MGYAELIEKLQSLPKEKQSEVFDFVEYLATRFGTSAATQIVRGEWTDPPSSPTSPCVRPCGASKTSRSPIHATISRNAGNEASGTNRPYTPFPYSDLAGAKLRPVLLLRQISARYDEWLVCMISSQLQQAEAGFDEILTPADADFADSGLKAPSVLRLIEIGRTGRFTVGRQYRSDQQRKAGAGKATARGLDCRTY